MCITHVKLQRSSLETYTLSHRTKIISVRHWLSYQQGENLWTLTTDRKMVRSDALPTELRGTCQHWYWIFKSCFIFRTHCKDQALKHIHCCIALKEAPLQWLAIDSEGLKLCPHKFAVSIEDFLSSFITKVFFVLMHHLTLTSWAKAREKLDDKWHVCQHIKTQRLVIRRKIMIRKIRKKLPKTATWCGQMLYPLSCRELVCM